MHISAYKWGARIYDSVFRNYTHKTLERILQALEFKDLPTRSSGIEGEYLRLLDLACGTGELEIQLVRLFPQIRIIALDNSPEMLSQARYKLEGSGAGDQVTFVQSDFTLPLPFGEATFDYVVFANALHYVARPDQLLTEIRRVIKPEGRLIIEDFTVQRSFPWAWAWFEKLIRLVDPQHYRTYTFSELNRFVTTAGFIRADGACFKINWWWRGMFVSATRATNTI